MPCKDVILHARASSSTSRGVRQLAKVPLGHSEEGAHKVFMENGCSLGVPISHVDIPTQKGFPYVKMTDWVKFLGNTGRLEVLTGAKTTSRRESLCEEFWMRFKEHRPNFPLYALAQDKKLCLKSVIPILHHGDEGRTYRKMPIMILSSHGLLGAGSAQSRPQTPGPVDQDPMGLNFLGSTMITHFICCAMQHTLYKPCPEALDQILTAYAEDLRDLAMNGVEVIENGQRKRLFLWCVGFKGDLPYLGKSGHFGRSFSMCPKRASAKKAGGGICWMCHAGMETLPEKYPWEDFSLNAKWISTMCLEPHGFSLSAPLLKIPHDIPALMYRLDLWHCFHLGAGKAYVASAIAVLVDMMPESSVERRLEVLSADYRAHCKRKRVYGYYSAFSQEMFGIEISTNMPGGRWNKGFVTTRLLVWLEDYLQREWSDSEEPLLREVDPRSDNSFLRFWAN